MYNHITIEDFIERMNQKDVKNNFSGSGLVELYRWLSAFDELLGDENAPENVGLRFDAVEICSNYEEYESLEDYHNNSSNNDKLTFEELEQKTGVIQLPNSKGFILEKF